VTEAKMLRYKKYYSFSGLQNSESYLAIGRQQCCTNCLGGIDQAYRIDTYEFLKNQLFNGL